VPCRSPETGASRVFVGYRRAVEISSARRPDPAAKRRAVRRSKDALQAFLRMEASGGLVPVVCAAAALLVTSPVSAAYDTLVHAELHLGAGELRDRRAASMPAVAALGGVVLPALIFLALVSGGPEGRGWGIPMATDIASAVGVLALLGDRVPGAAELLLHRSCPPALDDLFGPRAAAHTDR
jgi:Na+/H+ antiporter NhaA